MDILLTNQTVRSTYTLKDLQDRVAGDLELAGSYRVKPDDYARWANEAQDKLAKLTYWYRTTVYIDAVAGQREYPLPNRCLAVSKVLYQTRPLICATISQLDAFNPFWRSNGTGTPFAYYLRGNAALGIYLPPPSGISAAFTVEIAQLPPKVSTPDDNFYVPVAAEDAIIVYAKLQASLKDSSGEGKNRIAMYKQEWNEAVQQLRQQVDEVSEQELTIMGEEADERPYGYPRISYNPWRTILPG